MSDRVRLDDKTEKMITGLVATVAELAADVNTLKHTLTALATQLQLADQLPELVSLAKAEEVAAKAQESEVATRRRVVSMMMATCEERGPAARRAWLEQRLAGSKLGPIRQSDLEEYKLLESTNG